MAQSSPQPESVDTLNYARVNPLPLPATSSSSLEELHLHFESDTISPSSSQELLLQGDQQPHPTIEKTTNELTFTSQLQPQLTTISSWADEFAIAEQSGGSTPETVLPNWAYSGRVCGP